ncbi:hypothetical protein [Chryseobacterium indoltheticum]|uniref:Uncharacterized protein n=1 Tax=Chryseobacterium indoltheticum TaxID=254 RepID=A0A381F8I5_9FLAO|nr:hypothetical protein [Chryseobacterium indoltheticum]AZA73153.1 hypothetical protein EG358_04935 [Chryseobacterium indoltheticum]SIP95356.1 hypothetical protein SAMN05421682_101461 [Chryseobacterium indoltheticum]SUX42817.1 Uncharacterised protein [Chryseobacterium indoltheticum]
MKKITLLTAILVTGAVSAHTAISKTEKAKKISSKTIKIEKIKSVTPPEGTWYATTSCGVSAQTTQPNWTIWQVQEWAAAIERNYCSGKTGLSNSSGLQP